MKWLTLPFMGVEQRRLRELREAEQELRAARQIEIAEAARGKQIAFVRGLKAQMEFECSAYTDEVAEIESRLLKRRAERYLLSENDLQIEGPCESHWEEGRFGNRFLRAESMRKLARQVRDAEASARDNRMKYVSQWASLIFGFMGLTIGIVSLLAKTVR